MAKVGVIMGSRSDLPTMENAIEMLKRFGVEYEVKIVSAHRTPELMFEYAKSAKERGIKVIIAGAGLPGVISVSLIPAWERAWLTA